MSQVESPCTGVIARGTYRPVRESVRNTKSMRGAARAHCRKNRNSRGPSESAAGSMRKIRAVARIWYGP